VSFDHVTIRASDRGDSERFYRTVLGAIGITPTTDRPQIVAWNDFAVVASNAEHPPTRHLHVAFAARSRAQVEAFWQAGIDAGYAGDGAPGLRPQHGPDYYGAFLLDPDGNSAEAVQSGSIPTEGNIDHLWIGVRDWRAAERFYTELADYSGFRPDHRWDQGRLFRAAGQTTFSLMQDGRPPTEELHLAFGAADRETVDAFHRAALDAGYQSNGGPGERPQYHPGYYAAFVFDPDGTNVELVFHGR
jgi:catechol 2,3-dioxygenase-like lactoylglutathione lyase family enzyme